jgi:hypothetical protein
MGCRFALGVLAAELAQLVHAWQPEREHVLRDRLIDLAAQPDEVGAVVEPVGERLIWWNFVASSQARIDQAKADWKAGRMKLPSEDDLEFIPLPEEPVQAQAAPAPVEPKPTDPV